MSDKNAKSDSKDAATSKSDIAKRDFAARPCAICGKPSVEKYHPFCSKRCADIDLHHWLKGSYALPAAPSADDEDDDPAPPSAPQDHED